VSSRQSPTPAGAYRRQDGHAVFTPAPGVEPHPQQRLPERAPPEYSREDVRVLWGEAEPVRYPDVDNEGYARYHAGADLLLIAEYGFIQTVIELTDRDENIQEYVRRQVEV